MYRLVLCIDLKFNNIFNYGSFELTSIDNDIIVRIIPIRFKMLGYSENNNAPNIVADIGSAPPYSIVAFPLSICFKPKLNRKYGNIAVRTA